MPTSTLTPGDERQDEKLNPAHNDYDRRFNDLSSAEKNGNKDAGNSNGNTTTQSDQDSIRNKESEGNPDTGGWQNNVSNQLGGQSKASIKNFSKKKGPLAAIIGVIGIGGISATMLFSPAMLLVHMKETLSDTFNSQLTAIDIRSNKILVGKLSDEATTGSCTVINIRCKYSSMTKKQIKSLEKAGITALDKNGKVLKAGKLGRGKPALLKVGDKTISAKDLRKEMRSDPNLRSAFHKAYNPKVAAFTDSVSVRVNKVLKISKKSIFGKSSKPEDLDQKLRATVSGDGFSVNDSIGVRKGDPDKDGKVKYYDSVTNEEISAEDYEARKKAHSKVDVETKKRAELSKGKLTKSLGKSTIKGVATVTAMGAGAVDSVCSGYRLIRAAGFAAKHLGMLQLIRYSNTFLNTADAIKAGDATPEQVEYLANIVTSTNSEGKSATDSYGYRFAAYGDTSGKPQINSEVSTHEEAKLADEVLRYTNGQLVADNVMTDIIKLIDTGGKGGTDAADATCGFVKSGWGQAALVGTAVVGLAVAFFSGGLSLGWGAGVQAGASVALGVAMAMIAPKLVDMASGTLVTGAENGNEAGNAIVSGMGAYDAQLAQGRGLAPLSKEDAVAYKNATNETIAMYAETEKLNLSPFDATNKNTFVGSIVSQMVPFMYKNSSSVVSSIFGSFSSATSSLISLSRTKAASISDFSKCSDADYNKEGLDLAADPFCNLQYGLDVKSLEIDPNIVLERLIAGDHIDETTGDPKSDSFMDYIKYCNERTNPIGGYSEDEDPNNKLVTGEDCVNGKNKDYTDFSLYLIDKSIMDEMDGTTVEAPESEENDTSGDNNSEDDNIEATGEYMLPTDTGYLKPGQAQDWGPRACNGCSTYHRGVDITFGKGNTVGKNVYAIADGTVTRVIKFNGSGSTCKEGVKNSDWRSNNPVYIKMKDGTVAHYLHMAPGDIKVKEGDKVKAGQLIGKINNCGQSFGAHLHFTMHIGSTTDSKIKALEQNDSYINPQAYLKLYGIDIMNGKYIDGR